MITGSSSLFTRVSILSPYLISLGSELASLSILQMTALDWIIRLLGILRLRSHNSTLSGFRTLTQLITFSVTRHPASTRNLMTGLNLSTLAARESKTKMLYTLNAFRSIQKRMALDLREFGSRDRAMGDGLNLVKPMEK